MSTKPTTSTTKKEKEDKTTPTAGTRTTTTTTTPSTRTTGASAGTTKPTTTTATASSASPTTPSGSTKQTATTTPTTTTGKVTNPSSANQTASTNTSAQTGSTNATGSNGNNTSGTTNQTGNNNTSTTTNTTSNTSSLADSINSEHETYKGNRESQYRTEIGNIDDRYDALDEVALKNKTDSISAANDNYQRQYDANAIQEILDRNAIDERMANMGLANSGLNATQQTAIALARGNRDASTTSDKQQRINDIEAAYESIIADNNAKRDAEKLAAMQSRDDDIANNYNTIIQGYNEYLDGQNELTKAVAKELISEGKIDEALALINGATGTTAVGTTAGSQAADPKTIPYRNRSYKKVLDRYWSGDFFGGSEWFYDPIDGVKYSDDELEEKLRNEGLTENEIFSIFNNNNLEDFMDNMAEGQWINIPAARAGQFKVLDSGTTNYTTADVIDDWMEYYDGDKVAQKEALEKYVGLTSAQADAQIALWYAPTTTDSATK